MAPIPSSSKGKVGDASGTELETTMPDGPFNPEEMKALLIVAPVVALYSPIVLPSLFTTNRFPPDNAMPNGPFNPEEMKELLIVAPVVALYSPIVLLPMFMNLMFATNRFPPDNAMPGGKFNPEEMKELLIVAPVVALYSPTVLLPSFVTKIWARPLTGMRQSAATTAAKRTSVENLKILTEGLVFMGLVL